MHVHGRVEGGDFCELARGDGAASAVDSEEQRDSGGSACVASGGVEFGADQFPREPDGGWTQRSVHGTALALRAGESVPVSQGASTIWNPRGRRSRMHRNYYH